MAKLGTVFVELSLDDKIYKQKLSETLTSTQTTAKGIETSWKVLGAKNDATYDAQRRSYENAMTLIKNSTTSTHADIVRAEEAKNAKIKSLNDQQKGQHTSFMESMKKNWMAMAATATVAIVAIRKAWDLAEGAADYGERIASLDALGRKYGMTGQQIINSMQGASRGLLSMADAANMSAKALNLSLSPKQMIEFTKVSEQLTDVIGGTIPEAFERMTIAAASGRTMTLAQMGIQVDLDAAYKKHGENLTEVQKQQIRLNVILEAAKAKTAELGPPIDTTRDKMDRMMVTVKDLQLYMGQGIIRAASGAVGAFQTLASGVLVATAGFYRLQQASMTVQSWMSFGNAAKMYAAAAKEAGENAKVAMGASEELAGKALGSFAVMTAGTNELSAATVKNTAISVAGIELSKKEIEAAKKAAEEDQKLMDEGYRQWFKMIDDKEDADIKAGKETLDRHKDEAKADQKLIDQGMTEWLKMIDDKEDADIKAGQDTLTRHEKEAEDQIKLGNERLKAERDIYSDLRGYDSQYYEASRALIDKQAATYRELGISKIAVDAWVTEELRKAEIQRLKASTDFFDGVKAGWMDLEDTQIRTGQAAADLTKKAFNSMADALTDFVITGKADFKSLADSIIHDLIRIAIQEAMVRSIGGIIGLFGRLFAGAGAAGAAGAGGGGAAAAGAIIAHTGGTVGTDSFPTRAVAPSVFVNAPRLHSGLMSDEFPAILQKGEKVIPKNQAGEKSTTNNFFIYAIDTKSFADLCRTNPEAIAGPVMQQLRDNKIRTEFRALVR